MNINHHNYEEYFILYWDNELTAGQKQLVEVFVQQNADLKEEFRLFGETCFTPETNISFENKELLAVDENAFINLSNYEENLLLYIDDELTTEQRAAVEKFAAQNSFVQKKLVILQKAKLQPEAEIVFPDKSVLYRTEKVRVVRLVWWRVAVAAAIILIAGLVTFRFVNTSKSGNAEPPIAAGKGSQIQNTEQDSRNNITDKQRPGTNTESEQKIEVIDDGQENITSDNTPVTAKKEKQINASKQKQKIDQPLLANNDLPQTNPSEVSAELRKSDNAAIAKTETQKTKEYFSDPSVTANLTFASNNITPPPIITEPDDKGGLKGLLRKATRVFERRTNVKTTTDDNKLLVGVFAVSLK